MVLDRKKEACPLRADGESLPQVEEIKYLGVFTSEGKTEPENDRWIDAVMQSLSDAVPICRGEEGGEPTAEALDLPVELRSYPHLNIKQINR